MQGEDPYLTGEYSVAFVKGFQENSDDPTHLQVSGNFLPFFSIFLFLTCLDMDYGLFGFGSLHTLPRFGLRTES